MIKGVLCFLCMLNLHLAFAQDRDSLQVNRPKVGLVLSGGGAKGMAHIGALKVIEEAGIEVDFIGGTSMGAIVGGLYAAGYSAAQLDSIFSAADFNVLIPDVFPRGVKTLYEKANAERYAITLPFDDFKISSPSAISSGQNIYNELVQLLYHVRDVRNFSELPIPFLCMATNAETGAEVLLDSGFLPEAILASGTLPSLFVPAEIDGQILIDGGVMNNYPIEEVRAMGADVIIGVDVQHGLYSKESLSSATDILLQIGNYNSALSMEEKAKKTDVYIKPDIEAFSVIDFSKAKAIIKSGEKAAIDNYPELVSLAQKTGALPLPKPPLIVPDSLSLGGLTISGSNNYSRGFVKGKIKYREGEPISFKSFKTDINNLQATDNFITSRYWLSSMPDQQDNLDLHLRERPSKMFMRLALHYDDLYKSAALVNLTRKKLFFKDGVASLDLILGDNLRYDFEYYVDRGSYWSFGVHSYFNTFEQRVPNELATTNFQLVLDPSVGSLDFDVSDLTNQIYIQSAFGEAFAIRLGAEQKFLKYSTQTLGNDNPDEDRVYFEKSNYISTYGNLVWDTYDDKYFPSKGLFFDGDFHLYLFSSDYNDNFKQFSVAKARMGGAFTLFPKLSLNLETEGGFKLGISKVSSFDFVLGGYGAQMINNFVPFYGYDFLSLPGNSYVKAYGRLDYEIWPKNHIVFGANMANVEDDIFRTGEWFTAPNYTGYAVGYGWETFFGPLQVLYAWSPERSDGNFFFSLGFWF